MTIERLIEELKEIEKKSNQYLPVKIAIGTRSQPYELSFVQYEGNHVVLKTL